MVYIFLNILQNLSSISSYLLSLVNIFLQSVDQLNWFIVILVSYGLETNI